MKLRIGDRVREVPSAHVVVTLVENHNRRTPVPMVELELTDGAGRTEVVYLRMGQQAVLTDVTDFAPGDVIVAPSGKRYEVRNPVRTRGGLLSLRGPLGGKTTRRGWRPGHLPPGYRLEDDR